MRGLEIFKQIISLLRLTPYKQKIKFYILGLLIIFASAIESLSVFLIIPVYSTLTTQTPLSETLPVFGSLFNLPFKSILQEQLFALAVFAIIFTIANILKGVISWQACIQTANASVFLFSSAYSIVLEKPYEQLSNENISRFSSNFNTTNSYFNHVLKNIFLLIGYISTSIILIATLLYINPKVTIFVGIFLIIPYFLFSKLTNPILSRISKQKSSMHEEISKYIQDAFKSLKTIKHLNANNYYTDNFQKKEFILRRKAAIAEFIGSFPKLILEVIGICLLTILFGITYFLPSINLPIIYIITLAFAAQKILPTLQQMYFIWTFILAHSSSVEDLYNYFFNEKQTFNQKLHFENNEIIFKNISYKYPNNKKYTLNNFNLRISYPNSIAITGHSGCGKTTLIDLLTGLLSPAEGSITLPKELKNIRNIGYVPQEVPIINGTILDNIFLGDNKLRKDDLFLKKCIEIVELKKFIKNLPAGLNTILGEQSINLSGGQRQRIGILRALIRKPKVIILDESTNAIDTVTEQKIIENLLYEFNKSLIISISHNHNINTKFNLLIKLNEEGELIK